MTGADGARIDLDAVGEGAALGEQAKVDVGEGLESAVAGDGTAAQAGAGTGEGEGARALGPEREAGLRVSEAWEEPLGAQAGASRPEPGRSRSCGSNEGTGAEGRVAGVGRGEGTGGSMADSEG